MDSIISSYIKPWVFRLLNSFIGVYVENLSSEQLDLGVRTGVIDLRDLKLKKSALDKLGLPFDVVEGRIGRFLLTVNWSVKQVAHTPLKIEVEDIQILIAASTAEGYSPEEEELREQQLKFEKLERAEALRVGDATEQVSYTQSFFNSIIARIVNNAQVSIKNVHLRYEDSQTVPEHPFAAGVTLASLSAVSVDENWQPKYLDAGEQSIHKLAHLDSLALYFNSDSKTLSGLSYDEAKKLFREQISSDAHPVEHQYILQPVSGEGRIILNKEWGTNGEPQYDAQLLFKELGFTLDNHQYRDIISLADVYHIFARQHKYRRYRPVDSEFEKNKPRALWKFATTAILEEVHDKNVRWTWEHFRSRRVDRHKYVDLFKRKELGEKDEGIEADLEGLEKKLSYNDIRFYRSIARSQLRKDKETAKLIEQSQKKQQSWGSWLWGSNPDTSSKSLDNLSDEERKGLYEILDYDEKSELIQSFEMPRDTMNARVNMHLNQGSFRLKDNPHVGNKDIVSLVFDSFEMGGIQRQDNFEISLSLGDFRVFDGTTTNTLYKQIVHVKESERALANSENNTTIRDSFFSLKYEYKPLDDRADNGLTVYLRSMEIIYQRGYVESVIDFFKPPESQIQSVEALLNVAGDAFEGIQKETRAGLEYALETHKTVDLRLDMHAPIIIIPESVTEEKCRHLVIDAGRVLVESTLANKGLIREIEKKRNNTYSDDDYKQLESMMYDNYSIQLIAAQFVMGDSLEVCRLALEAEKPDPKLHLLERINIDLSAQNSIVPSARSIARFKVSGRLPNLHFNFSDTKYKTLMKIIDVALPRLGDEQKSTAPQFSRNHPRFRQTTSLFGSKHLEYVVDESTVELLTENPEHIDESRKVARELASIRQHQFELSFQVDLLQATLLRSSDDGSERELGSLRLDNFSLQFAMEKYVMKVDVKLGAINLTSLLEESSPLKLVSTETESSKDINLMNVSYHRVQKLSPDFSSVYEGFDQSVDVKLSTFVFRAVPEHVLPLYDYIMTTFVPSRNGNVGENEKTGLASTSPSSEQTPSDSDDRIRVYARLASFQVLLIDNDINIATLSLSTANVDVVLSNGGMEVVARLGNLQLSDDSSLKTRLPKFKQLLSIEGDEVAELRYQTYNPQEAQDRGINSSVRLSTGSLQLHILEVPLNSIYLFLMKFARLKGLYDAAASAAAQRAAQVEKMMFHVIAKSPVVILPVDPVNLEDTFTLKLGELSAQNNFREFFQDITAKLEGIQLASTFFDTASSSLRIVDDVTISTGVTLQNGDSRLQKSDLSEIKANVTISDINLQLTQQQYCRLMTLSQTILRIFSGVPDVPQGEELSTSTLSTREPTQSSIQTDLLPELGTSFIETGQVVLKKLDLMVEMPAVRLHLYGVGVTSEESLKDHGISSFVLLDTKLTLDMRTNGALQSQVWIRSFTMSNTKSGSTKFREIIPPAEHGRDQFHCLYTSTGGSDPVSQVIATVDSPHFIFSVDPLFALSKFFLSAFDTSEGIVSNSDSKENNLDVGATSNQSKFTFRFDLHDASVSILEDDQKTDTQVIRLSIERVSISQQNALILEIYRLGMSLTRMGKSTESVRFLDDVDIKLASESRMETNKQFTGVNVSIDQELIFRTSYRDILLITSIANKALALFSSSDGSGTADAKQAAFDNATSAMVSRTQTDNGPSSSYANSRSKSSFAAKVIMTTEELTASLKGIKLILIGDIYEAPVLDLSIKPFSVSVTDWSSQLQANTSISVMMNYWNLKNSHWEPLIDPWSFSVSTQRSSSDGRISLKISSSDLLDVNVSSNLIELAIATFNVWSKEGDAVLKRARGSYAPYRILNRIGSPIFVWSDPDGSSDSHPQAVRIEHGHMIDWRFGDWRKTREDGISSASNSIGIRFDTKPWEHLRGIPVDREGEYIYSLRPRTKIGSSRLVCEITLKDNQKVVTLRSSYKIENQTFYPLEVALVDDTGHPVYPIEKLAPGEDFALPIEAVSHNKIRIQPDAGFGYKWSMPIWWEDFREARSSDRFSIRCPHMERKEAPFYFTLWPVWSTPKRDSPQLKLNLRAPIELENLLPFDIRYKVFDKDTNHTWKSYLRKGGNTPIHSVELNHLVLLSITVEDSVYQPSEFTIINATKKFEFDQEHQVALSDAQGRKLNLNLNYVKFNDAGGAFKVQIYSPYVVVNKVGLPFAVKSVRSAGLYRDVPGPASKDELAKNTPFLLSHFNKNGNEFIFKVGESTWSQVIRFDAPSAEVSMVMPHTGHKYEFHLGLSWTEGSGKYKLSKVIELSPRFIVYNKLSCPIVFREVGMAPSGQPELQSGSRSSMLGFKDNDRRLLTIAYPGLDAQWSPPIDMESIGSIHVPMRPPGSPSRRDRHIVVVDILLDQATIFIVLKPHTGPWPFLIENKSSFAVTFGQIDEIREKPEGGCIYTVEPGKREQYAWDYPAMKKKKIYLSCNKRSQRVDIMEIGVLPPLRHNAGALSFDVKAEGPSQLLTITDYREEYSVYKPRRRNTESSIASTQEFEAIQEEVPPNLYVDLDLKGLGVSLMNKKLVEVVYLSIQNLKFEYTNSPVAQSMNVAFGTLQIDNQLQDAFFPVLLQPTPLKKEARGLGALPTVQASVIILNDKAHGLMFVKYASLLLQAITIEIDEAFLYAILDLTKLEGVNWETQTENVLIRNDGQIPEPTPPSSGQDVYFEVLELQPIVLSLSFVRNITASGDETQAMSTRNPLAVVLNALTMLLANVEGIELQLNALAVSDVRLTLPELQSRILYQYRREVLGQFYRVLGSADFIGNPVGLFTNVSSGVRDIFYEPYHGVVQHGGGELGIGLAKGAASFAKKTIFGLSDSVTKVTSSFGKGLSAATLDEDFQARRRMNLRRNKPRHALIGVTSGAEAFAHSIASSVEGVVMKPIEGADAEGALGFFKGMGRGLVGAVTKPVVGVFDLAANVSEGIRNTTTVFDAPQKDRVRKPRHVPADGVLEPYAPQKALGQSWMKDLQEGGYRDEFYISHIVLPGTDIVILLTDTRVISFTSRDLKVMWDLPFTKIQGVQGEHTGIRFVSKLGKEYDKFVVIQDPGSKEWFFEQVKSVVVSFNAKRRLER